MFELSQFYDYCRQNRVDVIPYRGMPQPGATLRDGCRYAVFLDFSKIMSTRLLRAVCAHEMGHVATGAMHKVSSPYELWERSEYLTAEDFREAFAAGCRELWELAEYFDLPEQDVKTALTYWTERRGIDFSAESAQTIRE